MGIIPLLYFVVTERRHPMIRRRGPLTTQESPPQRGLVEEIIALEEIHGRFVEFPSARPVLVVDENKRIRHLEVL
jgi:hypothetical protein